MASPTIASPPPRATQVVRFTPTDWKNNVSGALETFRDNLNKLHAQNPNFNLDDFVRYCGQPRYGRGWEAAARKIASSVPDVLKFTTGEKLHAILQKQLNQAIADTNRIAQGGSGKGGFSGDEIIDSDERLQLFQRNPIASSVLENVVSEWR